MKGTSGAGASSVPKDESEVRTDDLAGSPQPKDPAERRLRPKNCFNLVVSGTSANCLPIIAHLGEHARKDLNLMFAFDDDNIQQNWKTITRVSTSGRGDPMTKEFESVARVLHGFGPNHLLDDVGPGTPTRPRGKTSIPGYQEPPAKKKQKAGGSFSSLSADPSESDDKRSRKQDGKQSQAAEPVQSGRVSSTDSKEPAGHKSNKNTRGSRGKRGKDRI